MELSNKKVVILVEDQNQEMEVWNPLYRLREAGAQVFTAGTGKPIYKSKLGYEVKAEMDAAAVKVADIDAVVIPGGWAPDMMRRYEPMVKLVAEADRQGKVVAAICHAGWMLASAGILRGRKATSFFAIRDDVKNAGAEYVDAEVVVDRNLVTSRKPDDLPAFCREVIRLLSKK